MVDSNYMQICETSIRKEVSQNMTKGQVYYN